VPVLARSIAGLVQPASNALGTKFLQNNWQIYWICQLFFWGSPVTIRKFYPIVNGVQFTKWCG
jgi:hypothetical protein